MFWAFWLFPKARNHCKTLCFRAFGKYEKAQNTVFYSVFAPSEKAKRPKTLCFTVCSRLRKRPKGSKHCILQCFRAFGKGQNAQNIVFYNMFAPSERTRGQTHCILHFFRAVGKGQRKFKYLVCLIVGGAKEGRLMRSWPAHSSSFWAVGRKGTRQRRLGRWSQKPIRNIGFCKGRGRAGSNTFQNIGFCNGRGRAGPKNI